MQILLYTRYYLDNSMLHSSFGMALLTRELGAPLFELANHPRTTQGESGIFPGTNPSGSCSLVLWYIAIDCNQTDGVRYWFVMVHILRRPPQSAFS